MIDLKNIHDFLRGVDRFYTKFDQRDITQKIIWQEGSTSILDYTQKLDASLPILFFIPSLINKSYILDLTEENSMLRHFAGLGYPVYLVDFAEPLAIEANMGFSDYQDRIVKAMQIICKQEAVITIGYCLGGVFSCAIASTKKLNILKQVFIATPWDLSHLQQAFGLNNPLVANNLKIMFGSCDKISPTLIQWWFSALSPDRIWDKFCQFAQMKEEEDIDKFMAIEQWINDGISLSRAFALECLSMLENNDLQNEKFFKLNTDIPCLAIVGSEDKIVPISSCSPLYNAMLNRKLIIEKTGHIGLILSKLSYNEIWPEIEKWIVESIVK